VADNGDVLELSGDAKAALREIVDAYVEYSGEVSKMMIRLIIDKHPDISLEI